MVFQTESRLQAVCWTVATHVPQWNSIRVVLKRRVDEQRVSSERLPSPLLCLLHWTGLVLCLGLCVAIGDLRLGPGASPLWHTFSAAPPAWLSLLSKGGWCTFRKKQTNMEAVGVQVYRPCSFNRLWVWRLSICDIVGMRKGMIVEFTGECTTPRERRCAERNVCESTYNQSDSRFHLVQSVLCLKF